MNKVHQTKHYFRVRTTAYILVSLFALAIGLNQNDASAATPPDSCFAFNAGTGTITDYYDHEANNPANPACPRDVDIPSTIGGVSVTAITGPNTWTGAFYSKSITAVTFPDGLTTIGAYAFRLNLLTEVTIPNSVTGLGQQAFGSNNIANFVVQGNPMSIGADVLYENPVSSISYDGDLYNSSQPVGETCYAFSAGTITGFYDADLNHIKTNSEACLNNAIAIPSQIGGEAVTGIGDDAFARGNLVSVEIPHGVTSIGERAFWLNQLTDVVIPDTVTTIEWYAFYANRLTSVDIPNSVTFIENNAFFLQNKWGGDVSKNIADDAPYVSSSNPEEVQQLFDNIWYVRLYAVDPSNPNGLVDGIVDEYWEMGWDANANGLNDSLGGHIINPAGLTLNYRNASHSNLQTSRSFMGFMPATSSYIDNYYASQGPAYTGDAQTTLAAYYRIGDEVAIAPPAIPGYVTPPTQTFVLGAADTEASYVYASTSSGDGESGEGLADTGANLLVYVVAGATMIIASAVALVRLYRS